MKRLFLFLTLSVFCVANLRGGSSTSATDSLKKRITTLLGARDSQPDTLLRLYGELGQSFSDIHIDSAKYYLREGFRATKNRHSQGYAYLLHSTGEVYYSNGDLDSALFYFKNACHVAKETGMTELEFQELSAIGIVFRRMSLPDSSLFYYNKAVAMVDRIESFDQISYLYTNISVFYSSFSQEEALKYATKAVEAAEKCDDLLQQLYARSTKGAILSLLGRHREALDVLKKNLEISGRISPRLQLKNLPSILLSFEKIGQLDSTDAYMRMGEEWMRQIPERSVEAIGFFEIQSQIYYSRKAYAKSIDAFKKLLEYRTHDRHVVNHNIAMTYMDMNNYQQAFLYMEKAYAQLDSTITNEIQEQMSDFTIKYQTKEKELEIVRLQQVELENKNAMMQKTIWFVVILLGLLVLVLILLFLSSRQKQRTIWLEGEKKRQEEEFEALQRDTDLRLARKYIDGLESERERLAKELHDGVCNDLLGLDIRLKAAKLDVGEKEKISGILQNAYENIRSVSHALIPPSFSYATLEEMLEDYIFHLDKPAQMHIEFVCSCEIDWAQVGQKRAYELYRIIQEALRNVIKHSCATQVEVVLSYQEGELFVSVADNGVGLSELGKKGIGIQTIRERVCSIEGTCEYSSNQDGTILAIKVKL